MGVPTAEADGKAGSPKACERAKVYLKFETSVESGCLVAVASRSGGGAVEFKTNAAVL